MSLSTIGRAGLVGGARRNCVVGVGRGINPCVGQVLLSSGIVSAEKALTDGTGLAMFCAVSWERNIRLLSLEALLLRRAAVRC